MFYETSHSSTHYMKLGANNMHNLDCNQKQIIENINSQLSKDF